MTVPVQTTTAASASSFTFPGNVTAGNGVVICVARASSALFTFTPTSGGDTFSLAVEDSDDYTQIYYVKASSGGYQTINVLSGGLPESVYGYAYEVPPITALDKTSSAFYASTAVTAWTSGATATTTAPTEFWVGVAAVSTATSASTGAWVTESTLNSGTAVSGYQFVTTTGAATYSGTMGSSAVYGASVATFAMLPSSTDLPQIQPGPTWLATFKPGLPRPRPPVPPSFVSQVLTSGGLAMAPMAIAGNVIDAPPPMDLPSVNPGDGWMAHYKPGRRPRPPLAAATPSGPYFGNQPNLSDAPQIRPGPAWLDHFKPWMSKPRPPVPPPAGQTLNPGSLAMAPMGMSGSVTIYPAASGSAGMAPMRMSGTGQVPIVITSAGLAMAPMAVSGTGHVPILSSGSVAMAPMRIRTPSYLSDLPSLAPGPAWLDHFKPGRPTTLKIPGGPRYTGTQGQPGAAMAPMGINALAVVSLPFPQFPLNLKYEILINGTWTDISALVYYRDNQVIGRGLPDETQNATPVQMTLTLDNRDGRFSPLNESGLYYPYLDVNAQLRCSIVNQASASGVPYSGYRFWGELSSIPPAWDSTGNDIYCQVTVSGPFRRYVQGAKMGSALRQYYSGLSGDFAPYAAWSAEDGGQATQLASLLSAGTAMTFTGAPSLSSSPVFGGADPLPTVSGSTWHGVTEAAADPPGSGTITQRFPGSYTFTCPPGVSAVTGVTAIGGGGGGGDTDGTTGGGGGGGGGSDTVSSLGVTSGSTYSYTVGAGGAAGASGAALAGTASSFTGDSATITGNGGAGGNYGGSGGGGGAGGAGLQYNGGSGGYGSASTTSTSSSSLTGNTGSAGGGNNAIGTSVTTTWTAPPSVTSVNVTAGGAGGGGGTTTGPNGSGAGGAGGWASGTGTVTPGTTYTFQAGNGGRGGNAGDDGDFGGNSGLTGQVVAGGGQGGRNGEAGGAGGGGTNSGGNGGSGSGGVAGNYGGGGGGGGSGAGPSSGGGNGGDGSGRAPGSGSGNGGKGGWGEIYSSLSGQTTGVAGGASIGGQGGGGGGGGGSKLSGTGTAAGGGGPGWVQWNWTETGVPAGGGGGGSGGTSSTGQSGSGSGAGGSAVTGGGSGGSTGTSPSGNSPGGGGAAGVPSGSGGSGTASSPGNGAAGEVTFSWSGGVTSPVAADIVRFCLDVDSAGSQDGAILVQALTYGTIATLNLVYHTGGLLELIGYNSSSSVVFDSGPIAFSADGTPLYVSMSLTASGSSVAWSLSAIVPGAGSPVTTASGSVTGTVGYVSDILVNPGGTLTDTATVVGWLTVQTYADTLAALSPIVAGYAGELASVRIARLCANAGLGFELVGQDSDTPQMGPQQDDTFLNVLQSCATFDQGQLFETRDQFGVGYRTRVSMQGQNPSVIAYYRQAMLAAVPQPVKDDALIRNDITVTRNGGASATAVLNSGPMSTATPPNGKGDYTYSPTVQAYLDSQLPSLVTWMMTVGTVNEYRFPVLTFDMARSEVEALFTAIPSLDVGDFVQVPDPPTFLQNYPVNQLAWGFTETLNIYTWTIALNCVPESPYSEGEPPTW